MSKRQRRSILGRLAVLRDADHAPLRGQVAEMLREAVLTGQLPAGTRLPSTRATASELGVSRNTALDAYAQLASEGYLSTRVGSGTFVTTSLPESALGRTRIGASTSPRRSRSLRVSARGALVPSVRTSISDDALRPFSPGIPAVDPAMFEAWIRIAGRQRRHLKPEMLNYGDAAGYAPLRAAIAAYLGTTRGVTCTPEQVIVTAGTQHALDMCVRLLADPGDRVWIEDPGYIGARAVFTAAGLTLAPAPVDDEGLSVEDARQRAPRARLAYVSPSHQYPLGVTMSVSRRLQLLEWAERADAWILEDDYDSEFRYGSRPLPALQGLGGSNRVLYLGTFSKVLFPALRLAYVIVPAALEKVFRHAAEIVGNAANTIEQAALAEFISAGHFGRHVRRMRRCYEERRTWFVELVQARLGGVLTPVGSAAGLHTTVYLPHGYDDVDVSRRGKRAGLTLPALSEYYLSKPRATGLVMGYGHLGREAIRDGVDRLMAVLRTL